MKKIIFTLMIFILFVGCDKKVAIEDFMGENFISFLGLRNIVEYLEVDNEKINVIIDNENKLVFGFKLDDEKELYDFIEYLKNEAYSVEIRDATISSTFEIKGFIEDYDIYMDITMISDMKEYKKIHSDAKKLRDENILVSIIKEAIENKPMDMEKINEIKKNSYELYLLEEAIKKQLDITKDEYLNSLYIEDINEHIAFYSSDTGYFTNDTDEEILAVFKVKGFKSDKIDRKIVLICDADTFKAKTQKSFEADKTEIYLLNTSTNRKDLFFIGETTYYGYKSHRIKLYDIKNGEWSLKELSPDEFKPYYSYSLVWNKLDVFEEKIEGNVSKGLEYKYTYSWNEATETFEKPEYNKNRAKLTENEALIKESKSRASY